MLYDSYKRNKLSSRFVKDYNFLLKTTYIVKQKQK